MGGKWKEHEYTCKECRPLDNFETWLRMHVGSCLDGIPLQCTLPFIRADISILKHCCAVWIRVYGRYSSQACTLYTVQLVLQKCTMFTIFILFKALFMSICAQMYNTVHLKIFNKFTTVRKKCGLLFNSFTPCC